MEEQSWRKAKSLSDTMHKLSISTVSQTEVQGSSLIQMCAALGCLQARAPKAEQEWSGRIKAVCVTS